MKYRTLGKSPLSISEIGLGTSQLSNTSGRFTGVNFIPPTNAQKILITAVESGVTFLDTADEYGDAEALIGDLPPGLRKEIKVATKAGLRKDGKRDFSKAYLLQQLHQSLKRLKVERIDLFQVNKPGMRDLEAGELFHFLNEVKKSGKVHLAGVIVGEIETGEQCLNAGSVDCLQILYNLLYLKTEHLIEAAHRKGLGVIIRSPLNSGLLSGAYKPTTIFSENDERRRYFSGKDFEKRLAALTTIQTALGITEAALLDYSLNFILSNPFISTVIPGASSVEQVMKYIRCSGRALFSETDLDHIRKTVNTVMADANPMVQAS